MNLCKAVLAFAAIVVTATIAPSANAQLAAYGTVTVDQLSGIKGSPAAGSLLVNDSVSPLGATGGIYYDFLKLGPVKLGADLRGTLTHTKKGAEVNFQGTGARVDSALGGLRAVFHTRFIPLRPYLQASAGLGRSDYGTSTTRHNNFQYMGYAGLDITLLPIMDFRLVEFGYGGLSATGTTSHNYPIKSVSSGLVFHLPF